MRTLEVTAQVAVAPPTWDGRSIGVGDAETRTVRWSEPGSSPKAGDVVALPWDWICGRLSRDRARRLHRYTANVLRGTGLSQTAAADHH